MFSKAFRLFGLCIVFCLAQTSFAAIYTVTKTVDTNDGMCNTDCSLREAVAAANATPDNDIIEFSLTVFNAPQTITLMLGEMVAANNGTLLVRGPGSRKLTISGNSASRIFSTVGDGILTIENLGLTAGNGAGAANTGRGGAVYNNGGTLTLRDVILFSNAGLNGGALNTASSGTTFIFDSEFVNNSGSTAVGSGGALQNFSGSITHVYGTTFRGNSSSSSTGGGAIQSAGRLTVTNSTFNGNRAIGGSGGAIAYSSTAGLTMTNTTITNNTADNQVGGLHKSTTSNTGWLRNNIIFGNTAGTGGDVSGLIASQGTNIIGNVGTSTGWIDSDLLGQNSLLAPLGYYGGKNMTHALLTGSPAINAGQNCVVNLSCAANNPQFAVQTDQRGAPRPFGAAVDIGAFEVSSTFLAILPSALVNQSYNETIAPNSSGFTYSVSGGALPPGMSLSGTMPVILSGTPTTTGAYNFTVNIAGTSGTTTVNYRINVTTTLISGRIVTDDGLPIANAVVTITDSMMNTLTVRTNALGYFSFEQVTPGATYTLAVSTFGNRHQFPSRMITITPGENQLVLVANPPNPIN